METLTVSYPEFFGHTGICNATRTLNNKSIGQRTIRQIDQQKLRPYLAIFQCENNFSTKQSYTIIM